MWKLRLPGMLVKRCESRAMKQQTQAQSLTAHSEKQEMRRPTEVEGMGCRVLLECICGVQVTDLACLM